MKVTKAEFLYICEIMNGVECPLFTFRANVLVGMRYYPTSLDQSAFSRKMQALDDTELADLYSKTLDYWDTPNPFFTDNRLVEIGVRFES